ncbi:MAG: VCBS repeat-containing protein [Pseudomonadota bacterium]
MQRSHLFWQIVVRTFFGIPGLSLASHAFSMELEIQKPTNVNKPGFLFAHEDGSDSVLLVTSFAPFSKDAIFEIKNQSAESPSARSISLVTDAITWPNEVKALPSSLGAKNWVSVAGGFLVPGKGQGNISLLNLESGKVVKITNTPNVFYHRVEWYDMNHDGRLDIVTARANKPMIGAATSEMLWLEQPESLFTGEWIEHSMIKGPDVYFRGSDLDHDGNVDFLAAEFFGKKLSFIHQDRNTKEWKRAIIDDTIGSGFDLSFVDLNLDGKTDVLLTNHEKDAEKAAVFAYEIPDNLETKWKRHTLLAHIPTTQGGIGQASPGEAIAFSPSKALESSKPWIAIAGDGSQKLWLLEPESQDSDDWNYKASTPLETKSTIGRIEITDFNHDGYREIHVPAYDDNLVYTLYFHE